jgi:hypothetical protein
MDYVGKRPSVTITKEGYVVLTYTVGGSRDHAGVQMRYWVGALNPNGDNTQRIDWAVQDAFYDTGPYAALTFNTNDVLVDAHESANNNKLFYGSGIYAILQLGCLI